MQISFSANGTPDQVNASLYQQSKVARESNPDHAAPSIASLRDYLAHELSGVDREARVTVSATIVATVTKSAPTVATTARLDGKPDVRGADGLIHGDPLPDTGVRIAAAEPGAPNVTGVASAPERRKK